jgi:glutathione synthase/RimK-type ligase-like ATP-grasp enzyme
MKKNVLFVSGIPDNHIVEVISASLNGILNYKYTGTCDLYNYMSPPDWNKQLIMLDHQTAPVELSQGTHYIVNQIAEPDTHPNVLARLQGICDAHPEIPVFNAPKHIALTRRDVLYHQLKDIKNLVVPQTLHFHPRSPQDIHNAIQKENMHYPVILKAAGLHNGQQMARIDSPEDIEPFHAFALDGRPYYLIQYKDTAQQGIYTKHRLVMVRGKFYPRHLCALDHWVVGFKKAQAFIAAHPEYEAQEAHFITHFNEEWALKLAPIAQEIYKRIPLDFVGIDCCLLPDGQLMIFEMNANMLMLSSPSKKPAHMEAIVNIKTAIYEAVQSDFSREKAR